MIRSIVAVVVGYVVFGASAFALFAISGQHPHEVTDLGFMVGSTLYGMFFACLGGYIAALIAGRQGSFHAKMLALIIGIGAVGSMVMSHTLGWSQLAALFLMAPSATRGGWLRDRQVGAQRARPA